MRNAYIAVIGVALALVAVWAVPVPGKAGADGPEGMKVKKSGCCPFAAPKAAASEAAASKAATDGGEKSECESAGAEACPAESAEKADAPAAPSAEAQDAPSGEAKTVKEELEEEKQPARRKPAKPGRIV